jgi:hypothetical protein
MPRLPGFLRLPGAIGAALALIGVPLILLFPDAGILVALAALCLYPLLDAPRVAAYPSWWLAAAISAAVWFVLFIGLPMTANAVRPLDDGVVVLLLPFMLYPLALGISGLVRLQVRLRGRPRESAARTTAIVTVIACGLFIAAPLIWGSIPLMIAKITGNTPENVQYRRDGEVVSASADAVTVQLTGAAAETFRLLPDTTFDFRGPGSALMSGTPGREWLKAGQQIALDYVYRNGQAHAQSVSVWIERKGCAGDARWSSAGGTTSAPVLAAASLAGTTWEGWFGPGEAQGPMEVTRFEFLDQNRLAYQSAGGPQADGRWKQSGAVVMMEINDCYAQYEGRIEGDRIAGEFWNEMGKKASWTARRRRN